MTAVPAALLSALPDVLLDPDAAAQLRVRGATESAVLVALYAGPDGEVHGGAHRAPGRPSPPRG